MNNTIIPSKNCKTDHLSTNSNIEVTDLSLSIKGNSYRATCKSQITAFEQLTAGNG